MPDHDYQTPALHFNYNTILPQELRLWTTGEKERWDYREVQDLRDYLALILTEMEEPP